MGAQQAIAYLCPMIMVTGATGLVGSHVLFSLIREGKHVRAIARDGSAGARVNRIFGFYTTPDEVLPGRIEWVQGDVLDPGFLFEAFEGITQIYHCAAQVSFNPAEHRQMLFTNVQGTANVVNMALERGVQKLCHVSSIAALGGVPGPDGMDEAGLFEPPQKPSAYAKSKFLSEREVWRATEEGLPAVIVNPSVILGPGDWSGGSSRLFDMVYKGLKFYSDGVTGFVDVRDVADVMIRLMNSDVVNERFILNGGNHSYGEVFRLMAGAFAKPAPPIRVNRFMAELSWRALALGAFFSGRQPAITKETARSAITNYAYSAQKIQKRLGYEFIPLSRTIKDFAALYLSEKKMVKSIR